jgi:hypothetical protein
MKPKNIGDTNVFSPASIMAQRVDGWSRAIASACDAASTNEQRA